MPQLIIKKAGLFPERLGFTREGMLRDNEFLNGIYSSSYIYTFIDQNMTKNDKLSYKRVMTFKMASLFYLIFENKRLLTALFYNNIMILIIIIN